MELDLIFTCQIFVFSCGEHPQPLDLPTASVSTADRQRQDTLSASVNNHSNFVTHQPSSLTPEKLQSLAGDKLSHRKKTFTTLHSMAGEKKKPTAREHSAQSKECEEKTHRKKRNKGG